MNATKKRIMKSDLSVASGFRVRVTMKDGTVLVGVIEKCAKKWWLGSTHLDPRKVNDVSIDLNQ